MGDYWDDEYGRESIDYWRLCDELSVAQAAMLAVGVNPASPTGANLENWKIEERPSGYEAAKTAIGNALRRGLIEGEGRPQIDYDINGHPHFLADTFSMTDSILNVESLRVWLAKRGMKSGFFFPEGSDRPDYLDPNNPRYAPKLAAAVSAWLAVTDSGKKSPKQALEKWLREHAAQFGLVDDEGNPVNLAVEECSKVANWNQSGGAPKTPSS